MSNPEVWAVIILLTLATFIARSTFWLLGQHVTLSKRTQEALRYAPACALAAILVPDFVLNEGQFALTWSNPKLVAGVLAAVFFLWKRSMLGTIFFGMAVYTIVRLWF